MKEKHRRRVGLLGIQHESNTWISRSTRLADFAENLLVEGDALRVSLAESHHELGGFFAGLAENSLEAVPIFAARAMPYGPIEQPCADHLVQQMHAAIDRAGPLDGLLVAPHGAAVAENQLDFDGSWLTRLRERFPEPFPIIGTLDLHANLSPRMVAACDALIAYRTNPHLDQRDRGIEAARLMARTLRGEVRPRMAACFPPICINIERQATAEPHWRPIHHRIDAIRQTPGVLSASLLFGFPYADVPEMGAAMLVVTNSHRALASQLADELALTCWQNRDAFRGQFVSVAEAIAQVQTMPGPVGLLDMGDNVGGGSAADGTCLLHALNEAGISSTLAVLYDPEVVQQATALGLGQRARFQVGAKTDRLHGEPFLAEFTVQRLHSGQFTESRTRHGGMTHFNQGPTAVLVAESGLTVVVNSLRTAPFSLNQLLSVGVEPDRFQAIVVKGVHAPIAAYGPVCRHLVRVDTSGVTTANLERFTYHRRRRPLFPFEESVVYPEVAPD